MGDTRLSFNLIDEPWILVRTLQGATLELSIADVFLQANNIERLANELPTQDFAILRVLLAILLRAVVQDLEGDENPFDVWGELWETGDLPQDAISEYLQTWHHRFDLLDDKFPFMQVAGLGSGESAGNTKALMSISDNKPVLFTMHGKELLTHLEFDEAARWLIHVHAFDTGGIKTGVKGDPSANEGKSFGNPVGWAGRLGGVFFEGKSFRDTLLMNLVLRDRDDEEALLPYEDDLPVWERLASLPGDEGRMPSGSADLFTWQSRCVRLVTNSNCITGAIVSKGNSVRAHNLQRFETMTTWRRNQAQQKRLKLSSVYLPYTHSSTRAFWRGINAQIPERNHEKSDAFEAAAVVRWVGDLASVEQLDPDTAITLHATGMEYGVQNTVVSELIDDQLQMSAFLVSAKGERAAALVKSCLEVTDAAVSAYGLFARRMQLSVGSSSDQASDAAAKARSEAYFELGSLFRAWLAAIGEHTDLALARKRWHEQAGRLLSSLARALVERADTKSILGRQIKIQGGKAFVWVSAAGAEQAFRTQLRKDLPYAFDERQTE
ncbi:MAG: type I-E CRISPR-associated protein Cse1/CasA [Atopobiaceae bacterium]|nr:type I-E CRISPR-associated protein Cse1/CasA [Atopobiaceae bacterium]